MAYQVTYTTTFTTNAVPYDDWIASLDPAVLAEFGSPEPSDVFDEQVLTLNPAQGFISEEIARNDNVNTIVQLWETKDAYERLNNQLALGSGTITKVAESTTISGTGTSFISELSVGDEICNCDDNHSILGKVVSIESDTSLTVDAVWTECTNTDFEFRNSTKSDNLKASYTLYNLYSNTYIVSSTTTYANV